MDFRPNVVVHYKDGQIRKGYTQNFAFYRDTFYLTEVDSQTQEELRSVEVPVEDLKAVFFVKDFEGNPDHRSDPEAVRHGFGDRVEITFRDSETLSGYTRRYKESDKGFILYPADPETNNQIVAVIRSSTQSVKAEKKHSYFNI